MGTTSSHGRQKLREKHQHERVHAQNSPPHGDDEGYSLRSGTVVDHVEPLMSGKPWACPLRSASSTAPAEAYRQGEIANAIIEP
jgi:hypothetical protein